MIFAALILAQTARCLGALRPTGTSGLSFTTFIGRKSAPTDSTAKLPTVPTETVLRWPAKNESKQSFLSVSIPDTPMLVTEQDANFLSQARNRYTGESISTLYYLWRRNQLPKDFQADAASASRPMQKILFRAITVPGHEAIFGDSTKNWGDGWQIRGCPGAGSPRGSLSKPTQTLHAVCSANPRVSDPRLPPRNSRNPACHLRGRNSFRLALRSAATKSGSRAGLRPAQNQAPEIGQQR